MSDLYELPNGWKWEKLGELCEFIRGPFGGSLKKQIFKESGNAVYEQSHAIYNQFEKIRYFIDDEKFNEMKRFELRPNSLIMSCSGTIGKVAIVPSTIEKGIINQALLMLTPNDKLNNIFLKLMMESNFFKTLLSENSTGAAIANIASVKVLKEIRIPLPPLSEQQRIVSKLDLLFEKIDKSIALHQKNMDEADLFMGSVLNDVFGELEEKYGLDNIGNMIDILTDYHSNGAYKNLKANVELLDKEDYALMIRATDLENEDYTNNVKFITESAYNFMSKSKVYGGEIILPKIGTIGNVYFMPYLKRPTSLAMNLFMLRCSDNVMNKYMFLYLKSPKGNDTILSKANGAVTKTITKDAVRSIELALPPLHIQQKVVKYLDEISEKIEKVKLVQKEKMENLKALKASILDKAFRGEL